MDDTGDIGPLISPLHYPWGHYIILPLFAGGDLRTKDIREKWV